MLFKIQKLLFYKSKLKYLQIELNWQCVNVQCSVPSVPMLSWKLSMLEIPLDKELTANCLVETRTKLKELIPDAMVIYGLNWVQLSLWLKQSLINGFSWYGLIGP